MVSVAVEDVLKSLLVLVPRGHQTPNEDDRNLLRNFACVTYSIQDGKDNEEGERKET